MLIAYVDCFSGASGDMLLGACLDNGVGVDELREALRSLPVSGYKVRSQRATRGAIAGTQVVIQLTEKEQPHRHLGHILEAIQESTLSASVKERSCRVFRMLAEAEASVHGTSVESVHFHEVGAVDAICDVVGTVYCLEQLGVERVFSSPLTVGTGWVEAAHGRLPVPAPATAALLRGKPFHQVDSGCELLTPTGAALLVALAEGFGPAPPMTVSSVGYGVGSRELDSQPNLLRMVVGEAPEEEIAGDEVMVLETNLDDCTGEVLGYVARRLMEQGALDVYLTPVQMKKQRPGVLLSVLAPVERACELAKLIFAETGTFGIRRRSMSRYTLVRSHSGVETEFGSVRVKVGRFGGEIVSTTPEYEDCAHLAAEHQVALKEVFAAALSAAREAGLAPSRSMRTGRTGP